MHGNFTKGAVFTQIRELVHTLRMEYNTLFHVVFYTAAGKIVCDIEPLAKEDSLLGFTDDPTTFTVDFSAVFSGKDGYGEYLINAKNAVVYNHAGEECTRAEQMILFADQILGFGLLRKKL